MGAMQPVVEPLGGLMPQERGIVAVTLVRDHHQKVVIGKVAPHRREALAQHVHHERQLGALARRHMIMVKIKYFWSEKFLPVR